MPDMLADDTVEHPPDFPGMAAMTKMLESVAPSKAADAQRKGYPAERVLCMTSLPSLSKILENPSDSWAATPPGTQDDIEYPSYYPDLRARAFVVPARAPAELQQARATSSSALPAGPKAPAQSSLAPGKGQDLFPLGERIPCMSQLPPMSQILQDGSIGDSMATQYKKHRINCMSNLPSMGQLDDGGSNGFVNIASSVSDGDTLFSLKSIKPNDQNLAGRHRPDRPLECDPREVAKELPLVLQVHELLGTGSFSHVFRCKVSSCSEDVAVKVPTRSIPSEKDRELALLMTLDHPNLVRLLDTSKVRNIQALVLELCSGGSLTAFLHKNRAEAQRFGLPERIRGMLGIVHAIEYLHCQNIVHRDVKSGNCFLLHQVADDADELPPLKLGDMGLARPITTESMSRGVGTVRYMAPEVITSGNYGLGADIYSLGVMLHEMASGQQPYVRERLSEAVITVKVVQGLRPSLDSLPEGVVGNALRSVLGYCWTMAASMRLSAPELIAHLTHIQTLAD